MEYRLERSRAVLPSLFLISTAAFARIRESTMVPCPLSVAFIRAVLPYSLCISTDAFALIR